MKRILFIDRDGTLIDEAPPDYQLDSYDKLTFYPHMFEYMGRIAREFDYELVMVTNQDGLGTASFPEDTFWPLQSFRFSHRRVAPNPRSMRKHPAPASGESW